VRYAHLTPEHQVQVIQQRLLELEGQHYQLELNKQRRLAVEAETEDDRAAVGQSVAEIEAQQGSIDLAWAADAAELERLKPRKLNDKMAIPQGKPKR
jgi:hypothetical protein